MEEIKNLIGELAHQNLNMFIVDDEKVGLCEENYNGEMVSTYSVKTKDIVELHKKWMEESSARFLQILDALERLNKLKEIPSTK